MIIIDQDKFVHLIMTLTVTR